MSEELRKAARRFVEQAWNQGDLAAWGGSFSDGFAYHDPAAPWVRNLEEYRALIGSIPAIATDYRYTIDDMIAEGDRVVVRYSFHGTAAKSGKGLSHIGIVILRFSGERIAEVWDVWDALGVQRQLAGD
jgi:ketosteroid isomerase-like protein